MPQISAALIKRTWDALSSGYWFFPGMLSLAAMLLFGVTYSVDVSPGQGALLPEWFPASDPASARAILTTILTTSISVVSLTFSITIVALTLASSQFGTHLLYNFMRDRSNQIVLGVFIANFVYALLTLRVIVESDATTFVPQLCLQVSIGIALASTGFLIYFLHNIADSIQASSVLAQLQGEIRLVVGTFFPQAGSTELKSSVLEKNRLSKVHSLRTDKAGIVQVVDQTRLLEISVRHDLQIEVFYRAGHYVLPDTVTAEVYRSPEMKDVSKECLQALDGTIVVGSRRTHVQDIEFGMFQIVEIALRALSPGVNDSNIAIMCVNELGTAVSLIMRREMPPASLFDDAGKERVILKVTSFEGIVNSAFNQIRQNCSDNVAVMIRVMEVLRDLASQARTENQLAVLKKQAQDCFDSSFVELHSDREDLDSRYAAVQSVEISSAHNEV